MSALHLGDVERDDLGGRIAGLHLGQIERPHAHVRKRVVGAETEHVGRHVEPIGPDAELGVVLQHVRDAHRVEVPTTCDCLAGLRNREALE